MEVFPFQNKSKKTWSVLLDGSRFWQFLGESQESRSSLQVLGLFGVIFKSMGI